MHSIRALVVVLLTGTALSAQDSQFKTFGAGLEESVLQLTVTDIPPHSQSIRALVINDKGQALTTWRNVCLADGLNLNVQNYSGYGKVIGVHPTRDLALIELDLSKLNRKPKPAKVAKTAITIGDKILLYRWSQPAQGVVSGDTAPVDHPEYFWITGNEKSGPFNNPNGWASNQPGPDDWVLNEKAEIVGLVARVIVNGKLVLRVIPTYDVKPEEFLSPSQRKPGVDKARDLVQLAERAEEERKKPRRNYYPLEYECQPNDYLRLALAEDPRNADALFKLGLVRDDSKGTGGEAGTSSGRSLPDTTQGKSNDQVDTEFIRSRINTAMEHLKAGRVKVGQGILEDVVETYPKHPEAKSAKQLLDAIKGQK